MEIYSINHPLPKADPCSPLSMEEIAALFRRAKIEVRDGVTHVSWENPEDMALFERQRQWCEGPDRGHAIKEAPIAEEKSLAQSGM